MSIISHIPVSLHERLRSGTPLSEITWLKVGGAADWLFEPLSVEELQLFLVHLPAEIPIIVIGAGSNLLVRDGGIGGVVIRLSGAMAEIHLHRNELYAGAGCSDGDVARYAAQKGRSGVEFLIGIPGTIGGGLRMNAGCYGHEFKDVIVRATAVTRTGDLVTATPDEMGMAYRHSDAPQDWIFVSAQLATHKGDTLSIRATMKDMIARRGAAQPVGARTGGSTFANPDGTKAWQVIDAAGCRGLTIGGAHISEKHCNFLINDGTATAADLEKLGEEVRARVALHSNVELRWEIKRIGRAEKEGL